MKNKKKICIIGFGRFGKLFAEILEPYFDIAIISSRKIEGVNLIGFEDLKGIDIVVPAVPISTLPATLEKIKPHLKDGCLVMDVCSVKVMPCKWMKKILPKGVEILGAHPMFGPDSAKRGLDGLQMVLCPVRIGDKELAKLENIFKELKLKVIVTTPENHDRQTAMSLAMVHFIGRGLNGAGVSEKEITTVGFKRLLAVNETVNNDSWELFVDMHKKNPYAGAVRKKIIKALIDIDKKLSKEA